LERGRAHGEGRGIGIEETWRRVSRNMERYKDKGDMEKGELEHGEV